MERTRRPTPAMKKLQIIARPKISMSGIRSVIGCGTSQAHEIFDAIQDSYRNAGQLIYDRKRVLTRDFLDSQNLTVEDILRQHRIEKEVDLWQDQLPKN